MSGIGIGIGPGGQVVPAVVLTSTEESSPDEFFSYMETSEGIRVDIVIHTDNQTLADRYEADISQSLGWKIISEPESDGEDVSLAGELALSVLLGFIAGFALPFILFLGAAILHSARFIDNTASDWLFDNGARIGVITFVAVTLACALISILSHEPKDEK